MQPYVPALELQVALGGLKTTRPEDYERAVLAATSKIDRWTGRRFLPDAAPSTRLFRAVSCDRVCVGDFDSTAGVLVETDDLDDGSWVEWDPAQWQAEADDRGNGPFVRTDGEPWRWISATNTSVHAFPTYGGGYWWPSTYQWNRPRLRVTATWGWAETPYPVKQACLELAILYFQPSNRAPELINTASEDAAKCLLMDYVVEGGTLCPDLAP